MLAYVEILHNIWYKPFFTQNAKSSRKFGFLLASLIIAAMPTASPAALRSLVKTSLTRNQMDEARGDFSHSKPATDVNHALDAWFSTTASSSAKRVIVSSDDIAGVLFYKPGAFTVVSNVSQAIDSSGNPILACHLGNELSTIIPAEIDPDELLGESFVLLMKEILSEEPDLDDLTRTTPASDTVTVAGSEKSFFEDATFLHDPPDLTGMHVAKMPVCIPLPFGHSVKSAAQADEDGVQALCDALGDIDNRLLLWLKAMHYNVANFGGESLHEPNWSIPKKYFEPFQTTGSQLRESIEVSPSALVPTFQLAKNVVARLDQVRENNVDAWIQANKPIVEPIMMSLSPILTGGTPPPTNQPTINVQVAKTPSDKRQEAQKAKTIAIASLLLANVDEANDVLVPAKLSNEFIDLVEDGTAKSALRTFQSQFGDFCSLRRSDTSSVIHHNTNMPMGVVTPAFVGAFIKVYWLSTNLHDTNGVVGQNLSVFTLLPAKKESVGYKRIRDETNTAHGEQMVGETSSNTTKISTELFSSGEQSTYLDLKAAVSNVHALLSFMVDESERKSSRILLDITSLYDMLASHNFEEWFQYYATGEVTWLCHSILVDVHNVLRHMVSVSMAPANLRDVINQTDIKASKALVDVEQAIAVTIQKWNTAINQNNLSSYNSEPSTWAKLRKASENQESNKKSKSGKGGKNSSTGPNNDGSTNGSNNNSNNTRNNNRNNGTNNSWGNFSGAPRPSNPSFGLLDVTNQSAVHTCPTVGDNKQVCHKFITKGRSCEQGQNCRFAHITSRSNAADLATLHQWAESTNGITWLGAAPNQRRQGQPNGGRANTGGANTGGANTGGANTGRATNTSNSDRPNTNAGNANQPNTSG